MANVTLDVEVANHGSIWTFTPLTLGAKQWIDDNVEDPMWFGDSLVVEHRFVQELIEGLQLDGIEVGIN
jgi:hypothetical protein